MNSNRWLKRCTALTSALLLAMCSIRWQPASAEMPQMAFRLTTDRTYLSASALSAAEATLAGALYIDDYAGIASMKITLGSDTPLSIMNGDFAEPAFFADCDLNATCYTQISPQDPDYNNTCLWYGAGFPVQNGVVANEGGAFLTFDVVLPQGTAAGVYRIFTREGYRLNSAGQREYYCFAYNEAEEVSIAPAVLEIVVEPDALKGDVDCDGDIDADDATCALRFYTRSLTADSEAECYSTLRTPFVHTAMQAAEVDGKPGISADDAMLILRYYVRSMGGTADWETL